MTWTRRCSAGRPDGDITIDIVSYKFGIQEYTAFNAETQEVFQGCPGIKDGYHSVNERPGWGIEIDETGREVSLLLTAQTT
jgi:L-alanine-DL-glutamate epimerase-like enolase superfamily enzyme